jgi:leader peptidase (prepilin peptidase)/N-methyltransferase
MPEGALEMLFRPPLGWVVAGLWGALWGSFFNVAIYRLGREDASLRSLLHPPSHCPSCGTTIRAYDNVPLLGWLLLRGRCRTCHARISVRYPAIELAGVGAALAVYHAFAVGMPSAMPLMLCRFLLYFFFVGTLLVLAIIDLDTMLLPEAITLPAIPFFFLAGRFLPDVSLLDATIGLLVGFGALKGLQLGYAALTGREGLGGGDAMLMALVGGFLGWQSLPVTLGLGATFGTLVSLPLLLLQRRRGLATGSTLPRPEVSPRLDTSSARDGFAVSLRPRSPASQEDGSATGSALPEDARTQEDDPAEADVPLRHVEVPFGPFLVAAALCYLFFARAVRAWLLGLVDQP